MVSRQLLAGKKLNYDKRQTRFPTEQRVLNYFYLLNLEVGFTPEL